MSGDPVALLDQLDAKQLRQRLAALDRERAAIVVLIRAASARDKNAPRARRREVSRAH
jgi:hypothetical protein